MASALSSLPVSAAEEAKQPGQKARIAIRDVTLSYGVLQIIGASVSTYKRVSPFRSSGRPAAARPRCCACWQGWLVRPPAISCWMAGGQRPRSFRRHRLPGLRQGTSAVAHGCWQCFAGAGSTWLPCEERPDIIWDLLAKIGLSRHADKYPSQMSGGMQQRLQIARCLAQEPKVLLMMNLSARWMR